MPFNPRNHIRFSDNMISWRDDDYEVALYGYERIFWTRISQPTVDRVPGNHFRPLDRANVTNEDYVNSGYQKGHVVCVGNHLFNALHRDDTMFIVNAAPATAELNRRWGILEHDIRQRSALYEYVDIYTGLYFDNQNPERIGVHCVAVPTHWWKIVIAVTRGGQIDLEVYLIPNARQFLHANNDYRVGLIHLLNLLAFDVVPRDLPNRCRPENA